MPFMTVKCYQIVCQICGVAYDNGGEVPYFNTKQEAEEYVEPFDGEPVERAIARKCRIVGCGVEKWDKLHPKLAKKLEAAT